MPPWDVKKEREHEASNPGPRPTRNDSSDEELLPQLAGDDDDDWLGKKVDMEFDTEDELLEETADGSRKTSCAILPNYRINGKQPPAPTKREKTGTGKGR